jgi:hypothetical protein
MSFSRWFMLSQLMVLLAMACGGCGHPPPGAPDLPPPVVWKGSLLVSATIVTETDTLLPDSVTVTLDGVRLGQIANGDSISGIPEGTHEVALSARLNFITYISSHRSVYVTANSVTWLNEALQRADLRGSLLIRAERNGEIVDDSVYAWLDGEDLGSGPNPRLLTDLTEGIHRLTVGNDSAAAQAWLSDAMVVASDTTDLELALSSISVEEGGHAPDVLGINTDGAPKMLSDHWGEVIFLYFFEYT